MPKRVDNVGLSVGLVMKLYDLKARNIKPNDRPIADGTVPGLRLHPGKVGMATA